MNPDARSYATGFERHAAQLFSLGEGEVSTALPAPSPSPRESLGSLKGVADERIARAWRTYLNSRRPQDGVVCEDRPDIASSSGLRWVLDPIDGTVNAETGLPLFCMSIALEAMIDDRWRAVAGAVRDVRGGETFTAIRGGGAFLSGRRIDTGDGTAPHRAMLGIEFAYDMQARLEELRTVSPLLAAFGGVRSIGSSALGLCWLACGRLNAFLDLSIRRWDWCAGALIVEEAGGLTARSGRGLAAAQRSLLGTVAACLPDDAPAASSRGWS